MDTLIMNKLSAAGVQAMDEAKRAQAIHGIYHSPHEAYGVLLEEVDEFWEEVRKKRRLRSKVRMREELIQVAAVAIRAAANLT